ncbi:TerD family protein [Streptomyces sp. SM14]|uniref:TerD family protein n=2 Tax=Streptomyces TaxID=1883 RepID=UPI000CD52EC6|nr:TerD family protein [Streptomyces sp. SM14]
MNHVSNRGRTVPLRLPVVRAAIHWTPGSAAAPAGRRGGRAEPAGPADVDTSALLLDPAGRLRSERDVVGPTLPAHPSGQVRRLPKRHHREGVMDAVEVRLDGLEPEVAAVVLAVSSDGAPFGGSGSLQLTLWDVEGDAPVAVLPLAPTSAADTALVCGELHRTPGGWEFRGARRGYQGGLAELTSAHSAPAGRPAAPPRPAHPPAPPAAGHAPPAAVPAPAGHGDPRPVAEYTATRADADFRLPPQGPQFRTPQADA